MMICLVSVLSPVLATAIAEGATLRSAWTVELNNQPLNDVVIDITETSSRLNLNISSLTFTSLNWNIPQSVSITWNQ